MTKRYRIELTELELECLFIVADEGCARADAGDILSMGEGFQNNTRAARRARDKLAALLDERDAGDRRIEAPTFPPSFLDGSHDPERTDCACDWCEEGRGAGVPMEQPPGVPMEQPPGVPMQERVR